MTPSHTPTPTLYDISPLPIFPWVPGLYLWIGLAITFLFVMLLKTFLPKITWKPSTEDALARGLRELEFLAVKAVISKEDIYSASMIARRTLSVLAQSGEKERELTEMSAAEVRKLADNSGSPEGREVLLALLNVEELKYAPESTAPPAQRIQALFSSFKRYAELLRTRSQSKLG